MLLIIWETRLCGLDICYTDGATIICLLFQPQNSCHQVASTSIQNNVIQNSWSFCGKTKTHFQFRLPLLATEAWLALIPSNGMTELSWKIHPQRCPVGSELERIKTCRQHAYPRSEKWDIPNTLAFSFSSGGDYLFHIIDLVNIIIPLVYRAHLFYINQACALCSVWIKRWNMWAGFWTSPGKRVLLTKTGEYRYFFNIWNPNGFTSTGFEESHSLTLNEPVLIVPLCLLFLKVSEKDKEKDAASSQKAVREAETARWSQTRWRSLPL